MAGAWKHRFGEGTLHAAVSNQGQSAWGEHATEFLATGTTIRRLSEEHRLPETTPKPTFTQGLDT